MVEMVGCQVVVQWVVWVDCCSCVWVAACSVFSERLVECLGGAGYCPLSQPLSCSQPPFHTLRPFLLLPTTT